MSELLHIQASPRKSRSSSLAVAQEFVAAYRAANPGDKIEIWDLWNTALPEFDGAAMYTIMHGETPSEKETEAWNEVRQVFERFASADKYLISVPMWNFGIPYRLKHLIDVITQPGLAFRFSPGSGYEGLVKNKPVVVVYARGGEYSSAEQGRRFDFQKPYIETLLGFIGFADIESIVVEPTLGPPDKVGAVHDAAKDAARALAAKF